MVSVHTTPSVHVLKELETVCLDSSEEKQLMTILKVHFSRLFTLQLNKVKLFSWECQRLCDGLSEEHSLKARAAQVVSWRRSLLRFGVCWYAMIVVFDTNLLVDAWTSESQTFFAGMVEDRYREYFIGLLINEYVFKVGVLLGSVLAVLFAFSGAWKWSSHKSSMHAIRCSFLSSYIPQFMLLLCIPFREGLDYVGIQKQYCHDVMYGVEEDSNTGKWPAVNPDGLGERLTQSYNISIPVDFCEGDPSEWGARITAMIEDSGHLEQDGTCPHITSLHRHMKTDMYFKMAGKGEEKTGLSKRASAYAVNKEFANTDCPPACRICSEECSGQLQSLSVLLALYGSQALQDRSELAHPECLKCLDPAGLNCVQKCPEVADVLLAKLPVGSQLPKEGHRLVQYLPQCATESDLRNLVQALEVASWTSQFKLIVGAKYAFQGIATLLPSAFALMLGTWKAGFISKFVLPYSRIPGFALGASVLFTLPFVFQLCAVIQNAAGSVWSLLAFITLLSLMLLHFPVKIKALGLHGLMKPLSHEVTAMDIAKITKVKRFLGVLMLIFLLVYFATAEIFQSSADVMRQNGMSISEEQRNAMKRAALISTLKAIASFLGKSIISTVFFVDSCLHLTHHFHHGEMKDPADVQISLHHLLDHLDGIFAKEPSKRSVDVTLLGNLSHAVQSIAEATHLNIHSKHIDISAEHVKEWVARRLNCLPNHEQHQDSATDPESPEQGPPPGQFLPDNAERRANSKGTLD